MKTDIKPYSFNIKDVLNNLRNKLHVQLIINMAKKV